MTIKNVFYKIGKNGIDNALLKAKKILVYIEVHEFFETA